MMHYFMETLIFPILCGMNMQVRRISQLVLKREHSFIDTVGLGCAETVSQVQNCNHLVSRDQCNFITGLV